MSGMPRSRTDLRCLILGREWRDRWWPVYVPRVARMLPLALVLFAALTAAAFAAGATATVSPRAAKEGATFEIRVAGMKPGEVVIARESLPFGQTRTLRPRAGRTGRLVVRVRGQVVGTHRWCFRGRQSRRSDCTSYRVRAR